MKKISSLQKISKQELFILYIKRNLVLVFGVFTCFIISFFIIQSVYKSDADILASFYTQEINLDDSGFMSIMNSENNYDINYSSIEGLEVSGDNDSLYYVTGLNIPWLELIKGFDNLEGFTRERSFYGTMYSSSLSDGFSTFLSNKKDIEESSVLGFTYVYSDTVINEYHTILNDPIVFKQELASNNLGNIFLESNTEYLKELFIEGYGNSIYGFAIRISDEDTQEEIKEKIKKYLMISFTYGYKDKKIIVLHNNNDNLGFLINDPIIETTFSGVK